MEGGSVKGNVSTHQDALFFIRKGTRQLHTKLDKGTILSVLTDSQCNIVDYQRAMTALALAYQCADLALFASQHYCPLALESYQPRSPLILSDLSKLNVEMPTNDSLILSPPTSMAAYLGMRYVVEGAQLGGMMIDRNLSRAEICPGIQLAKQFWASPMGSKKCWPTLLKQLSLLQERDDFADAVRSARLTFRHFLNSFSNLKENHV